ncbi:MAG: 2-hydroxychromene-2-carboxylate isomerase [SAR324 cluster bacterium]|nr:2-hydroxychromene-2-carboxylate isomerase [SAR324 cluster bacterium]
MSKGILEFWYEFASTYSYLSVMRIEALAVEHKIKIAWKPFLLGPIFKEQGWEDSPFNIYPAKGRYMWRDMERLCNKRGLVFKKPTVFPRNGLLSARIAILGRNESWGTAFTKKVFEFNFVEDAEIGDIEKLDVILQSLNLDSKEIITQSQSKANKDKLKKQTEEAKQLGIFGSPSFIVNDEVFWGDDRLEDAINYLKEFN